MADDLEVMRGRVEEFEMLMGNSEYSPVRISVWLPDAYEPNNTEIKYPVLYMLSAEKLLSYRDGWNFHLALAKLSDCGKNVIAVCIEGIQEPLSTLCPPMEINPKSVVGTERIADLISFKGGNAYLDFIVKSLKPYIDFRYNTKSDKSNTAIGGSSMAGLLVFYGAVTRPNNFGAALIMSPLFSAVTDNDIAELLKSMSFKKYTYPKMSFYVGDTGIDAAIAGNTKVVYEYIKKSNGASKMQLLTGENATHDPYFWGLAADKALNWLF